MELNDLIDTFKAKLQGIPAEILVRTGEKVSAEMNSLLQGGILATLNEISLPLIVSEKSYHYFNALLNVVSNSAYILSPDISGESHQAMKKLQDYFAAVYFLLQEFFEDDTPANKEMLKELETIYKELNVLFSVGLKPIISLSSSPLPGGVSKKQWYEFAKKLKGYLDKLGKLSDRLKNFIGKLPAPRLKIAITLMESEIKSGLLSQRLFVAFGFAGGGILVDAVQSILGSNILPDKPSNLKLGEEVEHVLNKRYRVDKFRNVAVRLAPFTPKYIIHNNFVYTSPVDKEELPAAAMRNKDGTLIALVFARWDYAIFKKVLGGSDILENNLWWSFYREDTLDFMNHSLYEIKSVRSAAIGVIQEFYYRSSYNLVNAAFQDITAYTRPVKRLKSILKKITGFSSLNFLFGGLGYNWVGLLNPFERVIDGKSSVVMPFTVPELPGLVLYLNFEVPGLARLLLLSPTIVKALREELERLAREYSKTLQQVFYAIVIALALLVLAILLVALSEVLVPLIVEEGIAAGGIITLQRLIGLIPVSALKEFGLIFNVNISPTQKNAPATETISDALIKAAKAIELTPISSSIIAGDKQVFFFKPLKSNPEEIEQDPGKQSADIEMSGIVLKNFPLAGIPILETLVKLSLAIAATQLVTHFDQTGTVKPPAV